MLCAVLWSKDLHLLVFSIPHIYIGLFFCFLLSSQIQSPILQFDIATFRNVICQPCTNTFCSSFKKKKSKTTTVHKLGEVKYGMSK